MEDLQRWYGYLTPRVPPSFRPGPPPETAPAGGRAGRGAPDPEAHPTPEPTAPPPPQDRAKSNEAIASLTEKCWEKCMGYPGKSLSSREEQCFMNCARRFVDTTQFLKRELEDQAGGGR